MKSYWQTLFSRSSIAQNYTKLCLPSPNSGDPFLKTTKTFKFPLGKLLKVIYSIIFNSDIEKKTIVFDIDETLVYATTNRNEVKVVDETIFIKVTRFGGSAKAFLSFRPYLYEMLDELSKDFELILYTCGTSSYAQCF